MKTKCKSIIRNACHSFGGAVFAGAVLLLAGSAHGNTIFDTTPAWNGASVVVPFRIDANATYGQTITSPMQDTELTSFTFWVFDYYPMEGDTPLKFGGYVMAWDGSKAEGPVLYTSPMQSGAGWGPTKYTFDTGGIQLAPGGSYVLFVSLSQFSEQGLNGSGGLGIPFNTDAYSGGMFVSSPNGTDFSALSTSDWYAVPSWDLAFQATFVPEPSILGLLAVGVTALLVRRRRNLAA
jgi:hypothetical protein